MPKLHCDMDGVLANFDQGFLDGFGRRKANERPQEDQDWADVRATPGFYENLPPMPDMRELWDYIKRHRPYILTGVPASVQESADNKKAWVRKHLGLDVRVVTCPSRDKFRYCLPGDILIDDWERYKDKWIEAGGVWITHTSAAATIAELQRLGW